MARVVTRVGDVFAVRIDDDSCKYLQYAAKDSTQLGSDVIRAFAETYSAQARPDVREVVRGEVAFYAHCVAAWGVKLNLWEKVGHVADVGLLDVLFRTSCDWPPEPGEEVTVSHNWRVWRIGEPFMYVGELEGASRDAEIGVVKSGYEIVERLRTGQYRNLYPAHE